MMIIIVNYRQKFVRSSVISYKVCIDFLCIVHFDSITEFLPVVEVEHRSILKDIIYRIIRFKACMNNQQLNRVYSNPK